MTAVKLIPPRLLDVGMRVSFESGPLVIEQVLIPGRMFILADGSTRDFTLMPTVPVLAYNDGALTPGEEG